MKIRLNDAEVLMFQFSKIKMSNSFFFLEAEQNSPILTRTFNGNLSKNILPGTRSNGVLAIRPSRSEVQLRYSI